MARDKVGALLAPKNIVIAGASDKGHSWSRSAFQNLRKYGFPGPIYPFNPGRDDVWGERCYRSFEALPEKPDHVVVVGAGNAVNMTDGLDGLAIVPVMIAAASFVGISYLVGNAVFADYLQLHPVPGTGELCVFLAALVGAGLGFLWFNCHPAEVFMGDTGSLALGGVLGIMAVLIHQPFVLVIAGGVFVVEIISVLIQRNWFKFTRYKYGEGQRFFRMAPLHHHYQKLGAYESKIVTRFYIMCIVCAVLALATLKLR